MLIIHQDGRTEIDAEAWKQDLRNIDKVRAKHLQTSVSFLLLPIFIKRFLHTAWYPNQAETYYTPLAISSPSIS